MKNEGITILQIVVTIVIMIILASIAAFSGSGISREAQIASIYNEIKEIEGALNEAYVGDKIKVIDDVLDFYNGEATIEKIDKENYSSVLADGKATGDCYLLNFTSSKKLKNAFELDNVHNDYILDFNNLNIYYIKGIDNVTDAVFENSEEKEHIKVSTLHNSDDIEYYYNSLLTRKK